ncbi:MAG: MotA/TolQ/ExbB proton channel family protein [Chloroherpetonaceae bacterium]|nr:MotA/TolQ/ExbB proton channel family protein [bacterium]
MKATTLIGILIGIVSIFGAFLWEGGTIDALFMLPALVIVLGGTFAAAIAGTSWEQFKKFPSLIRLAFFPEKYNTTEIINQIVAFSAISRREGILKLEQRVKNAKHPYLRKFIEVCIDGGDPDTLDQIATLEINGLNNRHNQNISLFTKMGGYSPTMGIIGTVLGLISTLASAGSEPNVLIHHIATAFIATMWGIFLANIVWLPIADKLRYLHNEELVLVNIILEGIQAIQVGEIPVVIQARLISALPIKEQNKILAGSHARYVSPDSATKIYSAKEQNPQVQSNE